MLDNLWLKKRKSDFSVLYKICIDSKLELVLLAAVKLIQSAIPGMQILVVARTVDLVTQTFQHKSSALNHALWWLCLQGIIMLLSNLLTVSSDNIGMRIGNKIQYRLQSIIIEKSIRLPLWHFERPDYFNYVQRLTNSERLSQFPDAALNLVQRGLILSSYCVLLFRLNGWLAIALVLLMLPSFIYMRTVGKQRHHMSVRQSGIIRFTRYLFDLLTGQRSAKEMRVYEDMCNFIREKWSKAYRTSSEEQMRLNSRIKLITQMFTSIESVGGYGVMAVVLWIGSLGRMTVGQYVGYTQMFSNAQNDIKALSSYLSMVFESVVLLTDVVQFIGLDEQPFLTSQDIEQSFYGSSISVAGLSYTHSLQSEPTILDITCTIPAGATVAIVGENGSGKSTFVKCLLGLYELQSGNIYYGEKSIDSINPLTLRRNIASVFQDFLTLNFTVRENIAVSDTSRMYDDAYIREYFKGSDIIDFISKLPNGINTVLGPSFFGGNELSGGQWQKIAIARALFKRTPIIAFDEPTSALDPITEQQLYRKLLEKSDDMQTKIIVSHRMGICVLADLILVFKNGRLVENGDHAHLMNMDGEYRRLFTTQAKWYMDVDSNSYVMSSSVGAN